MAKRDPNELTEVCNEGQDAANALAETALRPSVQASLTLQQYSKVFGEIDLMALIEALGDQVKSVSSNDLKRSAAMLAVQAHTLDAIFNNLARRAINAEYMNHLEQYLKLALKAQSQCRSTWEAVSAIKNPPVASFVGQANIAHGPQQVNNGAPSPARGENPDLQNKLLEDDDGERLDTRATSTTGRNDPALATVG